MKSKTLPLAAAMAAALVLPLAALVACDRVQGRQDDGRDAVDPPPQSTPHKVPPIEDPLEVDQYLQDPCLSLADSQQVSLGVTSSKQIRYPGWVGCEWTTGAGARRIDVSYPTENDDGVRLLYSLQDTFPFGYLESIEVGGYTAVVQATRRDRERGQCTLSVAVRDDRSFDVRINGEAKGGCKAARHVAAQVLDTMKTAQ